jgi:hypothetical protein
MKVALDMRRFEQPVVMNANPSLCDPASSGYPVLKATGVYTGTVSQVSMAASGGGGSSSSSTVMVNSAQVNAFLCVGGDPSATITDARVKTDSMTVNLLFLLMTGASLDVNGTVQQITFARTDVKGGVR